MTRDPSGQRSKGRWWSFTSSAEKKCLRKSQPVFSEMFSSVVGDSWGGSVSVTQGSGGGLLDVVALGHHGGGDGLLHNGLSLDSNGHGDIVGGVNMDGS